MFIRLEHRPDNSARASFLAEIDRTLNDGERRFKQFGTEALQQVNRALSMDRNRFGALDLGADELRRAAAAADAQARASMELARATRIAAQEAGDHSQQARLSIAALDALAREEREAAKAALSHAEAVEQVQAVLNRQRSTVDGVVNAQRRQALVANDNAAGMRAQRFAFAQLGQQLQDVTIQAQMGTNAFTILTQQGGQAAFALSGLTESNNKLYRSIGTTAQFLSGPWGAAIFAATAVLGPYIAELYRTSTALDDVGDAADEAMKKLRQSLAQTSAFSDAFTEVAKKRVETLGDIAKVNSEIALRQARLADAPTSEAAARSADRNAQRLNDLRTEKRRLESELRAADRDLAEIRGAVDVARIQAENRDALQERPERERKARGGGRSKTSATEREAERAAREFERQSDAVRGILKDQERTLALQELVTQGRSQEADLLQLQFRLMDALGVEDASRLQTELRRLGISEAEHAQLQRNVGLLRQSNAEQDRFLARQQAQLSQLEGVRSNISQTLTGLRTEGIGAVGGFFERMVDQYTQAFADDLIDDLFGDAFTDAEERVIGVHNELAAAGTNTATALQALERAATLAAGAMQGQVGLPSPVDAAVGAAPEAASDIVVRADYSSPRRLFGMIVEGVAGAFVDPGTAKEIGKSFATGLEGAMYGGLGASVFLGAGARSPLGSAIGGAIGQELGENFLAKPLESIASSLGPLAGPLGAIAGGVLGSVIGGVFTSTPRASATIGGTANGLEVVSIRGNSGSRRRASEGAAGEAIDTLDRIAEALGATIDASLGAVSIGVRKGNYRVDTSGTGITKTKRGAIDFGEDSAAAIRFATMDLIQDGVLQGLRDSTNRLLRQSDDLDTAIRRALDFEGVFAELKSIKDPVGAAIDALDKEFVRLRVIFEDAGASAAEYADLEQLYGIRRAEAVREAQQALLGSLTDLRSQLLTGDTGLSLRARLANAEAEFDPLAERVRAGDTSAFDDFAAASQTMLEISRALYGSQDGYFAIRDEILGLTNTAIDAQTAIADAAIGRDSPFAEGSIPVADNAGIVSAIDAQTQAIVDALVNGLGLRLDAVNDNIATLVRQGFAAGGGGAAIPAFSTQF